MKHLVQKLTSMLPSAFSPVASAAAAPHKAPDRAYLAYTQTVTALAAKVACADDAPNQAEFDAFSALFAFEKVDAHLLTRMFIKHAQDNAAGAAQFARSIAAMAVPAQQREELLRRLSLLAAADGRMNALEIDCLHQVAAALGIQDAIWRAMLAPHLGLSAGADAYRILGISRRITPEALRARYIELLRASHPDQLAGQNVSDATRTLLHDSTRALVAAYESLAKQRKL